MESGEEGEEGEEGDEGGDEGDEGGDEADEGDDSGDSADEQMYDQCTCDGQNVFLYYQFGGFSDPAVCPNEAPLCTQSECEAAYPGICPKCTNANIAMSNR